MRSILFALLALGLAAPGHTAPSAAGVVTSVSGKVTVYPLGAATGSQLKLASPLHAGDRIQTGANGKAVLVLADGTRLNVNYNTDITLRDKDSKGRASARGIASIKIALGELWAKVTKKDSRLEFDTPAAVAAVKGTEPGFKVSDGPDAATCIYLLSGAVDLSNLNGDGVAEMGAMTQACLTAKTKITQALVQKWDGKNAPKDNGSVASGATVKLDYKDDSGATKTLELDYAK